MERFYQYPRNLVGVALLLLRLSVGLLLVFCVHTGRTNDATSLLTVFTAAICVGLCVGIMTEALSGIALISGLILLCTVPNYWSLVTVVTLLLCATTTLLGAGAYSLDGVLFGRRRIIL